MKFVRKIIIFLLIFTWLLSGWPQIWQNPSFPPQIENAKAQTADFNVQRGCTIMSNGSATSTLTAGSEYTAPTGEAFIRIVSTRLTGNGKTASGGNQNSNDYQTYFSDPDFAGGSVVLSRNGTVNDDRVCWEIIEYAGSPSGANEIIVRDVNSTTYVSTDSTVDGSAVSGVSSDSDIVVFITGQDNADTGRNDAEAGHSTAEWLPSTDTPRFSRGTAGSDANNVSYAVVEFTGSNWAMQRIEHNFTAAGSTETETITDVGALSRSFFHSQFRNGNGGLDELGAEAWLSATNEASFLLHSNATTPSGAFSVIWIVSNTDTSASTKMNVQHVSGSRAAADTSEGANNEEDEWTDTITAVGDTAQTSIMGESGRSAGTGTALPRGAIALYLNSTTGVKLFQSDDGQPLNYRFQAVEWPKSSAVVVSVTISDGDVVYGTLSSGQSKSTIELSDTQTAQNDGNVAEDLNIKTSAPSGWSVGTSPATDTFVHEFSTNDGGNWTKFTAEDSYQTLITNIADTSTQDFDLRFTAPDPSTSSSEKTITITIQAVEN